MPFECENEMRNELFEKGENKCIGYHNKAIFQAFPVNGAIYRAYSHIVKKSNSFIEMGEDKNE